MEIIVFTSERSLVVDRVEEKGDLVYLHLPGGGMMGVPADRIRIRYPGEIIPKGEKNPVERLPEDTPFGEIIARHAQANGLDWKIIVAVIRVESAFDPKAVSPKGAQGLMQLMPSVQQEEGVDDPFDPEQNIRAGVHYLKRMLEACRGDLEMALAAYNAGLSRVQAAKGVPNITETQNYVRKILEIYPTLGRPKGGSR